MGLARVAAAMRPKQGWRLPEASRWGIVGVAGARCSRYLREACAELPRPSPPCTFFFFSFCFSPPRLSRPLVFAARSVFRRSRDWNSRACLDLFALQDARPTRETRRRRRVPSLSVHLGNPTIFRPGHPPAGDPRCVHPQRVADAYRQGTRPNPVAATRESSDLSCSSTAPS